jgi:hypothetical protein
MKNICLLEHVSCIGGPIRVCFIAYISLWLYNIFALLGSYNFLIEFEITLLYAEIRVRLENERTWRIFRKVTSCKQFIDVM